MRPGKRAVVRRAIAAIATVAALGAWAATPALADGAFVIGDGDAAVGTHVTFWGAQWWTHNALSGGVAPAAFKGFAATASADPVCGSRWTTRPGNSSNPPDAVGDVIPVIVASAIDKTGPVIAGNVDEVVLVQTDPGYGPAPGHAGTGTVIGIACGGDIGPT